MAKSRLNTKTYKMVLSAVMVGLATVLSAIQVYQLPMGGGITLFGQVPVIVVSWLFGLPWGLAAGFVMGVIQMLFGLSNFGYVSGPLAYTILVLADYIVPFTLLGLGGMFRNRIQNRNAAIGLGALAVSVIRFICHFISGITIWGAFASDDTMGAIIAYSASYNGSFMIGETIITIVGCVLLSQFLFPRLDENGMPKSVKKAN